MAGMTITGLETQLLDKVFASGPSLPTTQRTLVQYAFRDFVNYFLELDKQAKATAQQNNPFAQNPTFLTTKGLHLDIQVEKYQRDDLPAQGQPVSVHKQENEAGLASLIEVYTPQTDAVGALSYQVTVIKLAITQDNLAQTPQPSTGGQVSQIPNADASGSAGDSLQDFLNRSPYSGSAGTQLWSYQNEDAADLIQEQRRQDDWKYQQHLQLLIDAAYDVLSYLNNDKFKAAFGMTEEEKNFMADAINNDPAEVAKKVLIIFVKKKRMELEMLRKELKDREELIEAQHKTGGAQQQLERILNFFDTAQRTLETQHIEQGYLQKLLDNLDQLNQALGSFSTVPAL
jgi:hypothetical protein